MSFSRPPRWVKRHYGGSGQWIVLHKKRAKFDVNLAIKLFKLAREQKIQLIHAHCETSSFYAGLICKLTRAVAVGTFHRSELRYYEPTWRNRMFYRFLNGYIAVSEERRHRIIEELGLPGERTTVVHWGVNPELIGNDIDKAAVREKLGLPNHPIILSLGHLGPIKGHDESIRALSEIKKDFCNAKLYIAGDGSEADSERLHGLIEELKLQDSVILLGQITNPLEWMKACDIFLQPSREEAFGLVFLEAGLCKKPAVATRVGGIPEIIVDGVTGFLVKPFRPDQIAEKLSTLLRSQDLREAMGNAARLRVEQEFNLGLQVEKLEQHFAKLIQSSRPSV